MTKPVILNVVSGKGGTGKSLLCAVLGRLLAQDGASILLVDFDVYVRGLSHFYYRYIKERRKITDGKTVSDVFELTRMPSDSEILAKERFFEVDLVPAVSEIEEQIDYMSVAGNTLGKAQRLLDELRKEGSYEFIIIDNRAGVDEIIIETSFASDITISVSESDPIARNTNDNLLRHLKEKNVGKVYTIVNKMKSLRSFVDYQRAAEQISSDFNVLGQIPFDLDLFETFGTARFWDRANSTQYAFALAECWNKMAKREEFQTRIDMQRFPRTGLLWSSSRRIPTFLTRTDRLAVFCAFILLFGYFLYDSFSGGFETKDVLLIYSLMLFSLPLLRKFVLRSADDG